MITDLLKFTVKEKEIPAAAELFRKQMKNNLGDEGCLMSKIFQSKTNLCEFYLLLCWENSEAIEKHLKSEHDLKFREYLDPILAGPPEFYHWDEIV
jgi:quinol monooxygenase YgiN